MQYFFGEKIKDFKKVPIIINNRNRIEFLLKLINSLETRGYRNIFIIDNNSSYPPLLEYYNKCPYQVFRLRKNVGHLSIWESWIFLKFIRSYYVYTDPDVVPVDECPDDFIEVFHKQLKKYKLARKVGFSLKIDDLPNCFDAKEKVIALERNYWKNEVKDGFIEANIDTTFALYRPFAIGGASHCLSFRSVFPYTARHMPWYNNSKELSIEELFYINNASNCSTWSLEEKK